MGSLDDLIRDLKRFEGRKEVTKQLRAEIRKPIPPIRKEIKRNALDILPRSGGLNVWVSKTRVTAVIKLAGRTAGVRLKGSRKSTKDKAELRRLDAAGRIRHPSWGRRRKGDWHLQEVTPSFFSGPAASAELWRMACVRAVDKALDTIRRG